MSLVQICTTRSKLLLRVFDDQQTLTYSAKFDPHDPKARVRTAEAARINESDLLAVIGRWEKGERDPGKLDMLTVAMIDNIAPLMPTGAMQVRVRALYQAANHASVYEHDDPLTCVLEALADPDMPPGSNPVAEWNDPRVAVLDLDLHELPLDQRPSEAWWDTRATLCQPRPSAWNYSHGLGAHLLFGPQDGYTGEELASAAALWWHQRAPAVSIELIHRLRLPGYIRTEDDRAAGPVHVQTGNTDLCGIRDWLNGTAEVTEAERDDWLAAHDLQIGQRYDHCKCPIGFSNRGLRDPVVVFDDGIFCHACAAKGRRAGKRSWAELLGKGLVSLVATLVRNKCHWAHARLILRAMFPSIKEEILQGCYKAALRLVHQNAVRLGRVFAAGQQLIRVADGQWRSIDGSTVYRVAFLKNYLADLPTCVLSNGTVDKARVDLLCQPADLTDVGYPPVSLLRGCQIYGQHLDYDDERIISVIQNDLLRPESRAQARPRYIPSDQRPLSENQAWEIVEHYLPGLNRAYLELLIAARGIAEANRTNLPPMILVVGPSSSAKSSSPELAAAIVGDHCGEVVGGVTIDRLRQGIKEECDKGSYVVLNEIIKHAKASGRSAVEALDPVLSLTKNSSSHVLYVGPRSLGTLPVLVCTDTCVGKDVHDDLQISRRLVYVRQSSRVDWITSLSKTAQGQGIDRFRLFSPQAAVAANVILSAIIDRHFLTEAKDWFTIAREIGFTTLEEADEFEDNTERLKQLYELVCKSAENTTETEKKRLGGKGWIKIHRNDNTDLCVLWTELSDGNWTEGRQVKAADWGRILGVPGRAIRIDIRPHGDTVVFVRFIEGTRTKAKVNDEILQSQMKLAQAEGA